MARGRNSISCDCGRTKYHIWRGINTIASFIVDTWSKVRILITCETLGALLPIAIIVCPHESLTDQRISQIWFLKIKDVCNDPGITCTCIRVHNIYIYV